MKMTIHRPAPALFAALLLAACHLYEGQNLDLFHDVEGTRLECRSGTHCPSESAICASGTCVECRVDADCGRSKPACVENACMESGVADDGGSSDAGYDVGTGDIEDPPSSDECTAYAHCQAGALCDLSAARCVLPDAEPPAPDAEPPAPDAEAPTAPEAPVPPPGPRPRR